MDASLMNPIWYALKTRQESLGILAEKACRYEPDVAPFFAVNRHEDEAFEQAAELMDPGESLNMVGGRPIEVGGLQVQGTLRGLQMVFPEDAELATGAADTEVLKLSCEHGREMLDLTDVAFPGLFRIRTCEMGSYYGVRVDGQLVAMAGERMKFDRYVEVSGVCTRPGFTGRGYAAALMSRLMWDHRRDGWISCLHTAAANKRAIELYERLGFVTTLEVDFHRVVKVSG